MDPIFEHPIFDSAGERWKVRNSSKNHKNPLKTRCTLVSNVGAIRYFPLQNRSGLLYSTSVEIATINGQTDYDWLRYLIKTGTMGTWVYQTF